MVECNRNLAVLLEFTQDQDTEEAVRSDKVMEPHFQPQSIKNRTCLPRREVQPMKETRVAQRGLTAERSAPEVIDG